MTTGLDTPANEIDLLVTECDNILHSLHKEEWDALIKLREIRKDINLVKKEKDYLLTLKNAQEWNSPIYSKPSTLEDGSINTRYLQLAEKFKSATIND